MILKVKDIILKLLSWCCMIAVVGLTVVVALQVTTRLMGISLSWTEELARFMLIWLTFLGCSLALYEKRHLSVDMFVDMAPKSVRMGLHIITRLIMIVFFGVLVIYGFKLTLLAMATISPSLQWPMGLIYSALPLSSIISVFFIAIDMIDYIKLGGGKA